MEDAKASGSDWKPNPQLLQQLIDMGISKMAAEHALFCTGNESVELAATCVFDYTESDLMNLAANTEAQLASTSTGKVEQKICNESYKMIFVMNNSLNMTPGKIAAQVAHAALGLYRLLRKYESRRHLLQMWESEGEKKIVLKGDNLIQLQKLEKDAISKDILTYFVHDAGHTQVAPNSVTVLALFGAESILDSVTGSLRLY